MSRLRSVLFCLLATTLPGAAFADEARFGLPTFAVPLDATTLRVQAQSDAGIEALDPSTGWTWTVAQVGGGTLATYPEPARVQASLARRSALSSVTDLSLAPVGDAPGSWFAGVLAGQIEQVCFAGRAGSLWVVSVRVPAAVQARSAAVHKRVCAGARWTEATPVDPAGVVGMRFDPAVPLDWQVSGENQATFNQSTTGLSGVVSRAPREGHPYDTEDVGILGRVLASQGFRVHGIEFVPVAGQDAARVEVARVNQHGVAEDWLLVALRGRQSLWVIQTPARSLGLPRLKELLGAVLPKAQRVVE